MRDDECTTLVADMKRITKRLNLTGMCDGEPLACDDAFEENDDEGARMFALTSSFIYKEMPEDIAQEHFDGDREVSEKLVAELRTLHDAYAYELSEQEW